MSRNKENYSDKSGLPTKRKLFDEISQNVKRMFIKNSARMSRPPNYDDSLNMSIFDTSNGDKLIEYIKKKRGRPARTRIFDFGDQEKTTNKLYFNIQLQPKNRQIITPVVQQQEQQQIQKEHVIALTSSNTKFNQPLSLRRTLINDNHRESTSSDTDSFRQICSSTPINNVIHKFKSKCSPITSKNISPVKVQGVVASSIDNEKPLTQITIISQSNKELLNTDNNLLNKSKKTTINSNEDLIIEDNKKKNQTINNNKSTTTVMPALESSDIQIINESPDTPQTVTPTINVSQIRKKNLSIQICELTENHNETKDKEHKTKNQTLNKNSVIYEEPEYEDVNDNMDIDQHQSINQIPKTNKEQNKTKYSTKNMSLLTDINNSSSESINKTKTNTNKVTNEKPIQSQLKVVIQNINNINNNNKKNSTIVLPEQEPILLQNVNSEPLEVTGACNNRRSSSSESTTLREFDNNLIAHLQNTSKNVDPATSLLLDSLFPLKDHWKTFKSPPAKKKRHKKPNSNAKKQKELDDRIKKITAKNLGTSKRKLYSCETYNETYNDLQQSSSSLSQRTNTQSTDHSLSQRTNTQSTDHSNFNTIIEPNPVKLLTNHKGNQNNNNKNNDDSRTSIKSTTIKSKIIPDQTDQEHQSVSNTIYEDNNTNKTKNNNSRTKSPSLTKENPHQTKALKKPVLNKIYEDQHDENPSRSPTTNHRIKDITNAPIYSKTNKKNDKKGKKEKKGTINLNAIIPSVENNDGLRRSSRAPKPLTAYWSSKPYILQDVNLFFPEKLLKSKENHVNKKKQQEKQIVQLENENQNENRIDNLQTTTNLNKADTDTDEATKKKAYRPGPKCSKQEKTKIKKNNKNTDKNESNKHENLKRVEALSDSGNISNDESNGLSDIVDCEMLNKLDPDRNNIDEEANVFVGFKFDLKSVDSLVFQEKDGVGIAYFNDSGNIGIIRLKPNAIKKRKKLRNATLVLFTLRGNPVLKSEGQTHKLSPGNIVNFPEDISYELKNDKELAFLLFQKLEVKKK